MSPFHGPAQQLWNRTAFGRGPWADVAEVLNQIDLRNGSYQQRTTVNGSSQLYEKNGLMRQSTFESISSNYLAQELTRC